MIHPFLTDEYRPLIGAPDPAYLAAARRRTRLGYSVQFAGTLYWLRNPEGDLLGQFATAQEATRAYVKATGGRK